VKVNLFEQSLAELEKVQRQATILLEARRTLAKLTAFIHEAGGGITEEELAETTLNDLAVIAARNSFTIEFSSLRPFLELPENIKEQDNET